MDFDTYYAASYERVRRAMVLTFRDLTLAEEIAQEAFFQTLRKWSKVSLLDHPEGWTMMVALNKGRDIARRRARQEARKSIVVQRPTSYSGEDRVDDRMMIATLLEGVSDRQREALLLRYVSQLTVPEIAVVMGCAEGTVKATLHAALANASHLLKGATHVAD
ncbi:MAG: sigma-70 family RNA polymerase sigma factor [Acidimicrobiales bacterium]